MENEFNFKRMIVWQKAMQFACSVIDLTEKLGTGNHHYKLIDQIEGSAASVPQNIAEGKGRITDKDFARFLTYSRGSLYETITLLNLFYMKKWMTRDALDTLEELGEEIVKMINGLLRKLK